MKRVHVVLSVMVAATVILFYSCVKDETPPSPIVNMTATLNGANEVPANASTNTGSATGTYNKDTKIINLTVTWSGFTATNAHIHKGPSGVSGGVFLGLGSSPFTSPLNFTSAAITQPQEDSLLTGLYYVNVHSATFPGGEIRGQLVKQ